MKPSITSDNTLPSSLRFPSNYPQLPHRLPFLPLRHLLSLHPVHCHLTSVLMFSGSWPSPLAFWQHSWRSSFSNGFASICMSSNDMVILLRVHDFGSTC